MRKRKRERIPSLFQNINQCAIQTMVSKEILETKKQEEIRYQVVVVVIMVVIGKQVMWSRMIMMRSWMKWKRRRRRRGRGKRRIVNDIDIVNTQ